MWLLVSVSCLLLSCSSGFALKEQAKLAIYSFKNRNQVFSIENEIRESLCSKFNSSGFFQCRSVMDTKETLIEEDMKYIQKDQYSLTGNISRIEFNFFNGTYIPFVLYSPYLSCQITGNIYLYDNLERKILKTWTIDVDRHYSIAWKFVNVGENDPDLIISPIEREKLLRQTLFALYEEVYYKIMNEIGEEI